MINGLSSELSSAKYSRRRTIPRVAVALMKAGMAEPTIDPWKVLNEAVHAVRAEGHLDAGEEEDLNAFGVFVL